jgi:hypothetical protein
MNNVETSNSTSDKKQPRSGCLHTLTIAAITVVVLGLIVGGWIKYNIYASEFRLTKLNQKEQKVLDAKLAKLEESAKQDYFTKKRSQRDRSAPLQPEAYSEVGAKREISLTEKELNALIANTPDVARKVAIDLSDNLLSLKLVVPMDEDIIILGGKTLRLNMGLNLGYEHGRMVISLKGVSLGGIPIPNAWLGYIKNRNLVEEFGGEGGFWDLFAEGIKDIKVRDGHILVRLNE